MLKLSYCDTLNELNSGLSTQVVTFYFIFYERWDLTSWQLVVTCKIMNSIFYIVCKHGTSQQIGHPELRDFVPTFDRS